MPIKTFFNTALAIAALLFWAWQVELLWLGSMMAVLLLLVLGMGKRFGLDRHSCHQIGDLCLLIAAGFFAFYWLDNKASQAVFPTLRLLPVALFPLLLLQYVHQKNLVPRSALLLMQRKSHHAVWIDMMPWFVLLCLFCAAATEQKNVWYFPMTALFLLALMFLQYAQRGFRQKSMLLLLFTVVSGLAFAGQLGLVVLQQRVETGMNQWLMRQLDHGQTSTAIGKVGRLKLSDEIVLRVQALDEVQLPLLLQTASFQRYAHEQWFAGAWQKQNVTFDGQQWQWRELDQLDKGRQLRYWQSFDNKHETLALPMHSYRITNLPANDMTMEQGGSIVIAPAQPFAVFDVWHGASGDGLPKVKHSDLHIPKPEAATVAWVAKSLGLYQLKHVQGEQAVLQALENYFRKNFSYSTWLRESETKRIGKLSPLSDFLRHTHTGHCEYFATATVLLLREVGIPARYAVGYAMQEKDEDNGYYVIRGRDAHAWALAWVDSAWLNVDNTPPNWFAMEDEDRGYVQDLQDLWSAWMLKVKAWRYADSADNTSLWLVLLLCLFSGLAWRILRRVKVEQEAQIEVDVQCNIPAIASWMLLEKELIDAGFPRFKGETLARWLRRIEKEELLPLLEDYYQLRFAKESPSADGLQTLELSIARYRQCMKGEVEIGG